MRIRANWNGDRAIGFLVGVVAVFMLLTTLKTGSPWPAFAGVAVVALGVFAPRMIP